MKNKSTLQGQAWLTYKVMEKLYTKKILSQQSCGDKHDNGDTSFEKFLKTR